MHFSLCVLALVFVFSQFNALAAPIAFSALEAVTQPAASEKRQLLKAIGSIGCNVARLQTVTNLAAASLAVKKVSTAASADAAASSAATTASDGLDSAKAAIAVIAGNILTGQTPSADARNQTLNGLTTAQAALAGINSTDSGVTDAVTAASAEVDKTLAAGQQVVDKC